MAIFQCDLRRKNYGALWNNLFIFFHFPIISYAEVYQYFTHSRNISIL